MTTNSKFRYPSQTGVIVQQLKYCGGAVPLKDIFYKPALQCLINEEVVKVVREECGYVVQFVSTSWGV